MLKYRQKFLLHFLRYTKNCSKLKLAKIFFLINSESEINRHFKFYRFVPYKFGPYSFELFHDLDHFERNEMVKTDAKNIKFLNGNESIPSEISNIINNYNKSYFEMSDKKLIEYIYEKYPHYTIFSKIKYPHNYVRDQTGVYGIGYEGLSIDEFLMKLINKKIQFLIDVRNNPWSLKYGFNRKILENFCKNLDINYRNIPILGIPSNLRKDLKEKKDYEKLFIKYKNSLLKKENELDIILQLAKKSKIAIMCFEKNPDYCHRTILIDKLSKMGEGSIQIDMD